MSDYHEREIHDALSGVKWAKLAFTLRDVLREIHQISSTEDAATLAQVRRICSGVLKEMEVLP